jgi:hypothetical protein
MLASHIVLTIFAATQRQTETSWIRSQIPPLEDPPHIFNFGGSQKFKGGECSSDRVREKRHR